MYNTNQQMYANATNSADGNLCLPYSYHSHQFVYWHYTLLSGGNVVNRDKNRSQEETDSETERHNHGWFNQTYQSINGVSHLPGVKTRHGFENITKLASL